MSIAGVKEVLLEKVVPENFENTIHVKTTIPIPSIDQYLLLIPVSLTTTVKQSSSGINRRSELAE